MISKILKISHIHLHLHEEPKNMYSQLEPVAKTLTKFQHDVNIADICEIYLELLQNKEINLILVKAKKK